MKQIHTHSFDSIKIVNLVIDRDKSDKKLPEAQRWPGIGTYLPLLNKTIKPLAVLIRYCECSKEEAFDLVLRSEAQERLEGIINS